MNKLFPGNNKFSNKKENKMYLSVKHIHKSNPILMIQCIADLSTVVNYLHRQKHNNALNIWIFTARQQTATYTG